ncbi:MAG: M48 family metallopeptidase [archaeon]|nr:M48 family metallopeptidase [archaeon]
MSLGTVMDRIASEKGWTISQCRFSHAKDFGWGWSLKGDVLEISVTDYLDSAPDDVLESFCRSIVNYILKKDYGFTDVFLGYIRSDGFILGKRPVFIKRSRNITRNDVGRTRSLYDSVQRLLDAGLLTESDIENTEFTWTVEPGYTRLGTCSQMFRVVTISSVLDDADVPERLLDYVVYHECMHLRQGCTPFTHVHHDAVFHRYMKRFPDADGAEKELREHISRIKPGKTVRKVSRKRRTHRTDL